MTEVDDAVRRLHADPYGPTAAADLVEVARTFDRRYVPIFTKYLHDGEPEKIPPEHVGVVSTAIKCLAHHFSEFDEMQQLMKAAIRGLACDSDGELKAAALFAAGFLLKRRHDAWLNQQLIKIARFSKSKHFEDFDYAGESALSALACSLGISEFQVVDASDLNDSDKQAFVEKIKNMALNRTQMS